MTPRRKYHRSASDPEETSARAERRACLSYINSTNENSEHDGDLYLDSDPRPNFRWYVTELYGDRLELKIPHKELSNFTRRWPDADIEFIDVFVPLPEKYYDKHDHPALNHFTVFILDFSPYDDGDEEQTNTDENAKPNKTPTRYFIGA